MDFKYEPGRILLPVLCRMQHKEMDGIIAGSSVVPNVALERNTIKSLTKHDINV